MNLRILAILLMLTGGTAAAQPAPTEWAQWLGAEASAFSGTVLIGRDDAIEIEQAFGPADPARRRPNRPETRFNLGSINKTFTAVAVAQLIQQGRLSLDDTLIKHLPDYPNEEAAGKITIRQLLTHRSGVAQFMRAEFGAVDVAEMVRRVAREPQAFEPGTRQEYSNGGYIVLGRVVEVASGQSYDAYVAEHIYRPAGMTASGFLRPGESLDVIALPPTGAAPSTGNPAGGGYSTASDLFKFSRALRTGRLLDARMTEFVLRGTFSENPRWGFSLREQPVGSRTFIGNGGGAPGVNAEFRFEPAGSYTVVVLSNASPPAATNLLTSILHRLAGLPAPAPQAAPAVHDSDARAAFFFRIAQRNRSASSGDDVGVLRHAQGVAEYYTDDARILGGCLSLECARNFLDKPDVAFRHLSKDGVN
jgi:D-alanyl-D-alanine carboxypeptidase